MKAYCINKDECGHFEYIDHLIEKDYEEKRCPGCNSILLLFEDKKEVQETNTPDGVRLKEFLKRKINAQILH